MRKDSIIKIMKLIGKLLILIAVIVLAIGGFSFINTRSFLAKAVEAEGTVVELKERDSDGEVMYSPVFEFTDNSGKEHTIYSSTSSYPPEYEVGEKIPVLYETENPKKARIGFKFSTFSDRRNRRVLYPGWIDTGLFNPCFYSQVLEVYLCMKSKRESCKRFGTGLVIIF